MPPIAAIFPRVRRLADIVLDCRPPALRDFGPDAGARQQHFDGECRDCAESA